MGGLPQHLEDSFFGGEGLPGFAVTDSRPNQKTCHVKDSRSKPRGLRRRAWQEYCQRQHMRQCGTLDSIAGVHRGPRKKFTVQDFRWPCPKKGKKRGYKEWPNSSAITAGHRASLAEMLALENSRHQRGGGCCSGLQLKCIRCRPHRGQEIYGIPEIWVLEKNINWPSGR